MTFNTGNPVGSTDPRDLFDNAGNLDKLLLGVNPFYPDRLGVQRQSWAGMTATFSASEVGRAATFSASEADRDAAFTASVAGWQADFDSFLIASGYVSLGDYTAGLNFTQYNQYTQFGGQFYRPSPGTLPFTTSGTWVGDDDARFVLLGDDVLRQDLASQVNPINGATLIGYKGRTAYDRFSDHPMLGDYLDLATALADAGNKTVEDPAGITYKDVYNQDLAVFTEATDSAWQGGRVHRADSAANHIGVSMVAESIEMRPYGSGANGPTNADYAQSISVIKKDWFNTTQVGELDGQNITIRQGGRFTGGVNSDCAGTLYNIGIVEGSGFAAAIESQTSTFDGISAAVVDQVQAAMGVIDSVNDLKYGFTTTANAGVLDAAFLANALPGGSWDNFLRFYHSGGVEVLRVDDLGRIVMQATSGVTPTKTLRVNNGAFSILNHAQDTEVFSVSDTGNVVMQGGLLAANVIANGAAVSAGAGTVVMGGTVAATANAGTNGAPPAQVAGYIIYNINGTQVKVPYYAD